MFAAAAADDWDGAFASNVLPHPDAASITSWEFRAAFRNHPAGVALITADAGEGPVALTASSVISVSLEPPVLVFSLSALSFSSGTITRAQTLVVHLLSAAQLGLAQLGAARGVDRYADRALWTRLPTGEPYFPSAHAWIRGQVIDTMTVGGSTIVAVQALQAHTPKPSVVPGDTDPLVYHDRAWHRLSESSRIPPV